MIEQFVFIFFIFSFAGWLIELVFRSVYERRPVNPGFHKGPWLPLYGFAGIMILLISYQFSGKSILIRMFFYFIICTAFEFVAGLFLEKIFHRRYWDYSQNRLNLMGLICPLYSFAWVAISVVVEIFILPSVRIHIAAIPVELMVKADTVLILVFTADFIVSSGFFRHINIERLKGLFNG